MTNPKALERVRYLVTVCMAAAAMVGGACALALSAHAQSAVTPLQMQKLSPAQQQLRQNQLQFQQPTQIQNQQREYQMNIQREQQRLQQPRPQPFQIQPQLKP